MKLNCRFEIFMEIEFNQGAGIPDISREVCKIHTGRRMQ
jgi:hypothetical protein